MFGSVAKGYQAGGFNTFTPPNPASPTNKDGSFEPEKMTNFEVGTKLVLPALNACIDASVFAYRFKNLQDIKLCGVGTIPDLQRGHQRPARHGVDSMAAPASTAA